MQFRTDVVYKDGKLHAKQDAPGTDRRQPLPEVKATDRLSSAAWGDALMREAGDVDPALMDVKETHTSIVKAFSDLMQVREFQSPDHTQAKHLQKVSDLTDRKLSELAAKSDRALERVQSSLVTLEGEAKKALGFENRGNAAELRAIMRGMTEKERGEVLGQAIQSKDGELLAAMLDGVHPL